MTDAPPAPGASSSLAATTSADGQSNEPRALSPQRVLFIGGLGRSGTTLVEKLLNELPATFAVGETIHVWERGVRNQERCGCGEPFEDCPQWSAVGQEAFGGWDEVDLDEMIGLRWRVDRSRRLPVIAESQRRGRPTPDQDRYLLHLRKVLLAAAAVAGQPKVLLESSKHLSTAALMALDDAIDLRVLHLVRDPRGVAYSWTKDVERPETDGEVMPTYRPARTAARWVTDNLGFEALALWVPTLRLRYEDVLADPTGSLRAIAEFVELDEANLDLNFIAGETVTLSKPMHSVAGNPLRFGGDEMKLALDEAWKTKLDSAQRRLVTTITAPMLWRYGYGFV